MSEMQKALNDLAGTTDLEAAGAANRLAGTTDLELVGALNTYLHGTDRTRWVELDAAVRDIMGDTGGGWSPKDITGLCLWLDASFLTLADGAAVAEWTDRSGLGNHATQGTAAARPILKTGVVNGKDVVRFDGTDDFFNLPNEPLTSAHTAGGTAFVVVKVDADPAASDPASAHPLGDWAINQWVAHYPYTTGVIYDDFGTTARKEVGNPTPSLAAWRVYTVLSGPNDWRAYLDGTNIFTTATNTVGFGNNPKIGKSGATWFTDGDIAEILIYDSPLSDADRRRIEGYLGAKYGIAVAA